MRELGEGDFSEGLFHHVALRQAQGERGRDQKYLHKPFMLSLSKHGQIRQWRRIMKKPCRILTAEQATRQPVKD
jgi:hypothetical protein